MLYHNIVHSPETRLVKRILEEQEKTEEKVTFYDDVKEMAGTLMINLTTAKELSKSQLKRKLKNRLTKGCTNWSNKLLQRRSCGL